MRQFGIQKNNDTVKEGIETWKAETWQGKREPSNGF